MYKTLAPCCIGHQVSLDVVAPIAEKYGFEGVWLEVEKDCQMPIEETNALLAKHHLRAAGFALPVEFRGDEAAYRADMERLTGYAEYAEHAELHGVSHGLFPLAKRCPMKKTLNYIVYV